MRKYSLPDSSPRKTERALQRRCPCVGGKIKVVSYFT
jgi:hypothetical protein